MERLQPGMREVDLFNIIYDVFSAEGAEIPCMVLAASENMFHPDSAFQRPRPIDDGRGEGRRAPDTIEIDCAIGDVWRRRWLLSERRTRNQAGNDEQRQEGARSRHESSYGAFAFSSPIHSSTV